MDIRRKLRGFSHLNRNFQIFRRSSPAFPGLSYGAQHPYGRQIRGRIEAILDTKDRIRGCDANKVHQGSGTPYLSWEFFRSIHGSFVFAQHQSGCGIWYASLYRRRFARLQGSDFSSSFVVHQLQRRTKNSSPYPLCTYIGFRARYYQQC